MPFSFASTELHVAREPKPVRIGGYRHIIFTPPGYNGASARIPDGRLPVSLAVTVFATSYAACETLTALFESGTEGDLEVPMNDDHWVYEDAFVPEPVAWEYVGDDLWQAQVVFYCPNPIPVWKSTGLDVF